MPLSSPMKMISISLRELSQLPPEHPLHQRLKRIVVACYAIGGHEIDSLYDLHRYTKGDMHLFVSAECSLSGDVTFDELVLLDPRWIIGFNMVAYHLLDWQSEKSCILKIGPSGMLPEGRGQNMIASDTFSVFKQFFLQGKAYALFGVKRVEVLFNMANPWYRRIADMLPQRCTRDDRLQAAARVVYHDGVDVSHFHHDRPLITRWITGSSEEHVSSGDTAQPSLVDVSFANLAVGAMFLFGPRGALSMVEAVVHFMKVLSGETSLLDVGTDPWSRGHAAMVASRM